MPLHRLTFRDLIEHGNVFLGHSPAGVSNELVRLAAQEALRELTSRRWTYLLRTYRLTVPAPYRTGTVVYDHSGGSSERLITLTSGTFPSWAGSATIRIANRHHKVSSRLGNTTLQLDSVENPGDDVSSSSFILFQNRFALPADFVSLDMPYGSELYKPGRAVYMHPNDWMSLSADGVGTGSPWRFTIMEDPDTLGGMAVRASGYNEALMDLNLLYIRRPRTMAIDGFQTEHRAGTVSTAGNTTLTGSSSSFEASFAGSIVRVSRSASVEPTGIDGKYPFAEERILSTFTSATVFSVTQAFSLTQSGRKYVISDPVDIDPVMISALKASLEYQIARLANKSSKKEQLELYEFELAKASAVDASRVFKPAEAGDGVRLGQRPANVSPPDGVGR